jgi:subtilase family serine protease
MAQERFVLVGAAPLMPQAAVRLGRVRGAQRIAIDVTLRPRDPVGLARFVSGVSTPGSPVFRKYLRPGIFGSRFGATAATVASAVASLKALGLHVGPVSTNHLVLKVSSSVAVAERAFGTTLERYRLGSAVVFANMVAPRVPAALGNEVQSVIGLSELSFAHPESLVGSPRSLPANSSARARLTDVPGGPQPCAAATIGTTSTGPYTADQVASAYGLSSLYAAGDLGAGQTVAIVELEPFAAANVRAYDECYYGKTAGAAMASPPHLNVIDVNGKLPGVTSSQDVESTLDVEEVSGFVPQATIDVYESPNNTTGPVDVYNAIFTQDLAKVVSTSWGTCEAQAGGSSVLAAEANLFEEAAAQGQTVLAASGDDGSSDCTDPSGYPLANAAVDDPASQPYVTAVGGTSLKTLGSPATASAPAVAPVETAWNSQGVAGGGGISSVWAMPGYQLHSQPFLRVIKSYSSSKPCTAPSGFCREVPDVSANADPDTGLMINWSGSGGNGWGALGGTSIASPLWAALVTLADALPACGGRPIGFLNPSLYWIAGLGPAEYANAFNDVRQGNNHLPQFPKWWQYSAGVGYDLVTGLGSPVAANAAGNGLIAQLCTLPESGGALYASPTRSSISAVLARVKARRSASSWIKVTLRTALGLPIRAKRVILIGTATSPTKAKTRIEPVFLTTNAKGVAVFQVSDTLIQKVTYRATDLTDGVVLNGSATVSYVKR